MCLPGQAKKMPEEKLNSPGGNQINIIGQGIVETADFLSRASGKNRKTIFVKSFLATGAAWNLAG